MLSALESTGVEWSEVEAVYSATPTNSISIRRRTLSSSRRGKRAKGKESKYLGTRLHRLFLLADRGEIRRLRTTLKIPMSHRSPSIGLIVSGVHDAVRFNHSIFTPTTKFTMVDLR
jgi:hypothetical protein